MHQALDIDIVTVSKTTIAFTVTVGMVRLSETLCFHPWLRDLQ